MGNDIQGNIAADLDKDESVTVYLTMPERQALERLSERTGISMSDLAGGWIWPQLKQRGLLPESYARPPGR